MTENKSFKVVIVGDGKVGKTTFIKRHATGDFVKDYKPTVGAEITNLSFYTPKGQYTLKVWDCGGQERNQGLGDGYFCGAQAAIIMFDVTSTMSYIAIEEWHKKIKRVCDKIPIVIVGNKIDLKDRRVRPKDINIHRKLMTQYYDVSAKSNYNFEKPFLYLLRTVTQDPMLKFIEKPSKTTEVNVEVTIEEDDEDPLIVNFIKMSIKDEIPDLDFPTIEWFQSDLTFEIIK